MNRIFFLFFFLCLTLSMNRTIAQVKFNTVINKGIDYNGAGHVSDVDVTFDSGYVTVSGQFSLNVSKFSATGILQWSTDVAWGGNFYYARNIVQLRDSGFAVVGAWQDAQLIAFMRLDKNGHLLWAKTFVGGGSTGTWIAQALDGGLIIGGTMGNAGVLIKTDINGTVQWAKTYKQLSQSNAGFLNADSSYTVWGIYDNSNFYVAKMNVDKNGNVLGALAYNTSFFTHNLVVKKTADKGFIVLLDEYGTNPILMKTDSQDNIQWKNKYVFATGTRDPKGLEITDYGYVFAGESYKTPLYSGYSSAYWAKVDNAGNMMWNRIYDTQLWDAAYSVKQTPDKGLILWTSMSISTNHIDTMYSDLIKTDSSGLTTCTLYTEAVTPAAITITPGLLSVTTTAQTGTADHTNTFAQYLPAHRYLCPAPPEADFTADHFSSCPGSTVHFTDQSAGSPVSWKWTFSGGIPNTSQIQNPTVVYDTIGNFYAKLVVKAANGDSSVKIKYINIFPIPAPVLSAPDSLVCTSDSVRIDCSGSYAKYLWNNSDTLSYTFASLGKYWVTVTDANGCTAVSGQQNILPSPALSPPGLSTNDSLLCSTDSTRIDCAGSYAKYLWNNEDTLSYTFAKTAGGYWVTVTDANGCTAVSGHQNISVLPVPSVSIVVQGDTLASFNSVAYQWYYNDTVINDATSPVYVAHQTGDYSVQVTDSNGCQAISNKKYILLSGLTELSENNLFSVYPDPFSNTLFIKWNQESLNAESLEIYNVLGEKIISKKIGGLFAFPLSLDVSILPSGVYYLKVKTGIAEYAKKMIKN